MPMLKERKSLLIKNLTGVLLILTICCLPQGLLFLTLCTKQDRNIPSNTEVLVSACKKPVVQGVSGGEVLFVYEGLTDKMYLLDLRTGEKRKVPKDFALRNEERVVFLSSDLIWVMRRWNPDDTFYNPDYVLDLTDGQRYDLLDLMSLPRLENSKFNPDNYSYIQSADRIFIDLSENKLIALSTDFRANQNGRVVLDGGYISDDDEFLLKLVKNLGMDYENVDLSLSSKRSNTPSPTGKYFGREDGISISRINTRLALPYPYYFKSWYYDDSGVIVHNKYGTYWIITQFFGDYYHLSYPVLK